MRATPRCEMGMWRLFTDRKYSCASLMSLFTAAWSLKYGPFEAMIMSASSVSEFLQFQSFVLIMAMRDGWLNGWLNGWLA